MFIDAFSLAKPYMNILSDRASLLNDAFSLAEAGHISYAIPLSMTEYLTKVHH
jgi:hypothetical protein